MDVVWLKRDVRLHDHAPLHTALSSKERPTCILYLYEPSQLSHPTVHGSHVAFVNEGLLDLDERLTKLAGKEPNIDGTFQTITVCYHDAIPILETLRTEHGIKRILAHMETGTWDSFQRDKAVRKFCRTHRIPIVEYPHSGVTRCLKDRNRFKKNLDSFLQSPCYPTPCRISCNLLTIDLPGRTMAPLLDELNEIPREHRVDRDDRQAGGETKAMATLASFLESRGKQYSSGISSPNTSWTSGSRFSPFLTWGHLSLRYSVQQTKRRQALHKQNGVSWGRSLSAFLSRLHWRSHFTQKLETEPELEHQDLCPAYSHLRRQPGDWNEEYYKAWATGRTGFPFVDACMRCLIRHGWLNFRMRAMLVSFATYNLWLDWQRLAPHLARVFLDYEPGIHYPQLQMQAGTTGINAMRVYSVTKQSIDQDPKGAFIRKYVPELVGVPDAYIHEPSKMPTEMQNRVGVLIGIDYPEPVVDEKASAREAKGKVSQVRKQDTTKDAAQKVYEEHGSRSRRGNDTTAVSRKRVKVDPRQPSVRTHFSVTVKDQVKEPKARTGPQNISEVNTVDAGLPSSNLGDPKKGRLFLQATKNLSAWSCRACTFLNSKSHALVCEICQTLRYHGSLGSS